jgi:hypothetical protein
LLFIVVFVSYCFLIVFGAFVSYFLLVNRWNSFHLSTNLFTNHCF